MSSLGLFLGFIVFVELLLLGFMLFFIVGWLVCFLLGVIVGLLVGWETGRVERGDWLDEIV